MCPFIIDMPAKRRVSNVVSLPAPIKGWNVVDPLPSMKPEYAPILDNVFCLPSELQVRKGYSEWATFTGTCETLFDYDNPNGTEVLFAAVSNAGNYDIYDVSATGPVGAAVVTGLSNARFKHTHFATSGGIFTYIVNAADNARLYDGTTWHTVTGVSVPYAITGVDTSTFIDVKAFKRRLWFAQEGTLKCWYLATDSIAGAATEYDFSPVFARGGRIVKIDTWTLDAGYGVDDYFVIFTSTGEVAVYRGTDPASANTWALTGVFYIGAPVGGGRTCKFGGDLLIVNYDGVAQMSKSLMSSRVSTQSSLTDKVQPALASYSSSYASNYGWDILLYPPQNMLLVNIPLTDGTFYQCVMNTITGAWSRWTGVQAVTWYFANETLYFGGAGAVYKMWDTQADDGTEIVADILPAYQSFGTNSRLKRFNMARVILGYDGSINYGTRMEMDFNLNTNPVTMPLSVASPAGVYGVGVYGTALYGGAITVKRDWKNANGQGYWGSLHTQISTLYSDVRVYSMDLMMESGGNI